MAITKTFLIQSSKINGHLLPSQQYGYTAIQAINYHNWFENGINDDGYDFILLPNQDFTKYLDKKYIPIGSVDFVLQWLYQMGVKDIAPLNIPQVLWGYCKRKVMIDYTDGLYGHYMLKDMYRIKADCNGEVYFRNDGGRDRRYFLTKWVDDIEGEWRVFVFNRKIQGIRCYGGNELLVPDENYINDIISCYNKRVYTLDLFVRDKGKITDICELHDFFACGLYGFEDYRILPTMWISAIDDLLKCTT